MATQSSTFLWFQLSCIFKINTRDIALIFENEHELSRCDQGPSFSINTENDNDPHMR
jgi:hypothetical protein